MLFKNSKFLLGAVISASVLSSPFIVSAQLKTRLNIAPITTINVDSTIKEVPVPPLSPSNVTFVHPLTQGTGTVVPVTVSWTDNSNNETGFNISVFYQNGQLASVFPSSAPANATSYTFGTSTLGFPTVPATTTPMYFTVRANNSYGVSAGVTSLALPLVKVPEPMTDFSARYIAAPKVKVSQIRVTWTDELNELGYTITRTEKNLQGLVTTTFISLPKDSFQYVDTAITSGLTYTYQMVIFNSYGISRPTLLKTVIVPALASAPVTVEALKTSRIQGNTIR